MKFKTFGKNQILFEYLNLQMPILDFAGGSCKDYGSGLNCSCPVDYTGIGCQYEFDACAEGACQNGASCVDNGPGYKCICPTGFTGKNCEQTVPNCKPNSCPPTATCVDLSDGFYCKCPFNLTGEDCRKSKFIIS